MIPIFLASAFTGLLVFLLCANRPAMKPENLEMESKTEQILNISLRNVHCEYAKVYLLARITVALEQLNKKIAGVK